jgi:glycosyltransferase involved in cell wall biosynthesis
VTRVLFLTESFHPVFGGGERHIRALGRRLVAAGDAATVVTRRGDAAWPAAESLDGIEVRRVSPTGGARLGKYLMALPAAWRTLREARSADLVVVRGTRVLGLPGLIASRLAGRPVVLQAEVNGEMSGEIYLWGTPLAGGPVDHLLRALVWLRNLLLRDADGFLAMSREIEAEFLGAGLPRDRVTRIPHGVDTRRFRPADPALRAECRRELDLEPGDLVVCWTGRLLRGKGLERLLDAFAVVVAGEPRARLVLVGSGEGQSLSIEAALRERAGDPPLAGRVRMPGRVDAVERALAAADLFVFPSEFEALGLSLIEAAACGLPAVASRTGGIVDVVDEGVSGLLVPPGDAGALAEALLTLLGDPEGLRAMGEAARARACREFDEELAFERYRALFAELAGSVTRRAAPAGGAP